IDIRSLIGSALLRASVRRARNDGSPTAGVIVFNGTIGNFTVNVSVGTSTRGSGLGQIDLNSINVLNSGSGALTITLADTGFNIGSPKGVMTSDLGGTIAAPANSSVTFQSWVNSSNNSPLTTAGDTSPPGSAQFTGAVLPAGTNDTTLPQGPFPPLAYSSSVGKQVSLSGDFALFSLATIQFSGPGSVSFDHTT